VFVIVIVIVIADEVRKEGKEGCSRGSISSTMSLNPVHSFAQRSLLAGLFCFVQWNSGRRPMWTITQRQGLEGATAVFTRGLLVTYVHPSGDRSEDQQGRTATMVRSAQDIDEILTHDRSEKKKRYRYTTYTIVPALIGIEPIKVFFC